VVGRRQRRQPGSPDPSPLPRGTGPPRSRPTTSSSRRTSTTRLSSSGTTGRATATAALTQLHRTPPHDKRRSTVEHRRRAGAARSGPAPERRAAGVPNAVESSRPRRGPAPPSVPLHPSRFRDAKARSRHAELPLTSSDSLSVSSQTTTIVPAAHPRPPGLMRMLIAWLGIWPAPGVLRVAPSARRVVPGWDGQQHPLGGVIRGQFTGTASR
jgi:hypothetical protein